MKIAAPPKFAECLAVANCFQFFVFDDIKWGCDMSGSFVKINSEEAAWATGTEYADGNMGHRPRVKGGYFPVPPIW